MYTVIKRSSKTHDETHRFETTFSDKEKAFDYADYINLMTAPWEENEELAVVDDNNTKVTLA